MPRKPLPFALVLPAFSGLAACSDFPESPKFDEGGGGGAPQTPAACATTNEAFEVALVRGEGEVLRCEAEGLGEAEMSVFETTFDAVVVSAEAAAEGRVVWELQSCLGGLVGCLGGGAGGTRYTLTVSSPGLGVTPPAGTAVRVAYTSTSAPSGANGCSDRLEVRDLTDSGSGSYWLAGNLPVSAPGEEPGGPLGAVLEPLSGSCAPDLEACTGGYALRISQEPGAPVVVPMGETRNLELGETSGAPGSYSVRNLKSRLEETPGGCAPASAFWLERRQEGGA